MIKLHADNGFVDDNTFHAVSLIRIKLKNVMMKRFFCLTLIATGISIAGFSQADYKNALGIRIAPSSYFDFVSVSYKTFITTPGAIEINAGLGRKGYTVNTTDYNPFTFSASAAYLHHFTIPVEGLRWFVGGGLIMYNSFTSKNSGYRGLGFGFFPTGGIDYKFPSIPLNLSTDYRPTIFFSKPDQQDSFYASNFGVTARYTLGSKR